LKKEKLDDNEDKHNIAGMYYRIAGMYYRIAGMYYRIAGMYYRNTTQNREDMEEELSEKYD
jgi:hypothetical protein